VAAAAVLAGAFLAVRAAATGSPAHSAGPPPAGSAAATGAPAPAPRPAVHLPVGKIGSYAVTDRSFVFTDRSRTRTAGPRILPTLVRYPVIPASARTAGRLAGRPFPLVVFAPGYLQCERSYRWLLRTWASAGYVVAAVEFPRTSCHAATPDEADLANQPGDLAFAIRRLLAISSRPRGALSGLLNPAAIAVAGHSDGGDTVAALAAGTCCLDHKVSAAVVLAGAEWPPLGGSYFADRAPPVLFVQGNADNINPPAASQQLYRADTTGPRFYLDLHGAGHLAPYEGGRPPEPIVARVTTDFLDRYLAGQRSAAAAMQRAGNVAGLADLVHGKNLPS
jgi:dienelactone hydrolase